MDFNQQQWDKTAKKIICEGVHEIRDLGLKMFTDSALVHAFHFNKRFINIVLQKLINQHKLVRVYRVYNSKDSKQYIDFTDINKIPLYGYISNKSKHLKIYVGKFTQIGVFYTFPKAKGGNKK